MKAEELRESLHKYIDTLDEAGLDEAFEIIQKQDIMWKYSAEDIVKFYERHDSYHSGKGRSFTMDESINSIRK